MYAYMCIHIYRCMFSPRLYSPANSRRLPEASGDPCKSKTIIIIINDTHINILIDIDIIIDIIIIMI